MPDTLIKVDLTQSAYENDKIHNRWHPEVPIVEWVSPGDDFIIETVDWTGGFIKNNDSADDVRDIDLSIVHFLSGPIGVKGAEPGDLLVVDLLDVGPLKESLWGFNGFFSKQNGGGFLTDHFPLAQKSIWDIKGLYTSSRHRRSRLRPSTRRPRDRARPVQPGQASGPTPCAPVRDDMFSSIFVDRPRLAVVIAIVVTIAGALALRAIPLSQFPDIVPPQVQVTATYPGASAQVVEEAVAQPIEAQMVGVDKSIYIEVRFGQRRQLHADGLLRARHQSRYRHRQRQQSRADGHVAAARLGDAPGPDDPQAILRRLAIHDALLGQRQAGPAVHHELRGHQRARRDLAHARRRPGFAVWQTQLFDAHLVRHRTTHGAQTSRHPTSPGRSRRKTTRPRSAGSVPSPRPTRSSSS